MRAVKHKACLHFRRFARGNRSSKARRGGRGQLEAAVLDERKQQLCALSVAGNGHSIDAVRGARAARSLHRRCSRAEAAWVIGVLIAAQLLRKEVVEAIWAWAIVIPACAVARHGQRCSRHGGAERAGKQLLAEEGLHTHRTCSGSRSLASSSRPPSVVPQPYTCSRCRPARIRADMGSRPRRGRTRRWSTRRCTCRHLRGPCSGSRSQTALCFRPFRQWPRWRAPMGCRHRTGS